MTGCDGVSDLALGAPLLAPVECLIQAFYLAALSHLILIGLASLIFLVLYFAYRASSSKSEKVDSQDIEKK